MSPASIPPALARAAGDLPIAQLLPELLERLGEGAANLVIEAPPGAGKTTVVPLAVLDDCDRRGREGEIIVLQPRRLAARLSALRVAALLGESVGERVGYVVRFERARSARTRILFMTEGVLLRRLRADPELPGVEAVLLDEFHERHLDGDIALALLRRLRSQHDRAPRLIAMSATLDAEPVAEFLDAARLRAEGRSFPVDIEYRSPSSRTRGGELPLEQRVARAVHELVERGLLGAANEAGGHALVFLPGAREIRACEQRCRGVAEQGGLELVALHGSLPREQQDRAVRAGGPPRLILATNVAETSITIDGVVAVIDSGLARVADFDPGTGLPRLILAPISRASAAQRAGRAGRTRAGVCLRLYTRGDHDHRREHDLPEVRRLDLTGPLLELAAAGVRDPLAFPWFEAPPSAAVEVAGGLLRQLEAVDEGGELTDTGRAMLRYPLHPRLARLLVEGVRRGVGEAVATVAALLGERALRRPGTRARRSCEADVIEDLELLDDRRRRLPPEVDRAGIDRVRRVAKQLRRQVDKQLARLKQSGEKIPKPKSRVDRDRALRLALLAAHPDRVAAVRVDDHDRRSLVFAFGGSAELAEDSGVRAPWVVALRSEERREGTRRRALVRSAAAIEPGWLVDLFPEAIVDDEQLRFDPERERVVGESALRYGKLAIESSAMTTLPAEAASEVLLEAARSAGAGRFCPGDALEQLRLRAAFLHRHRPELPELDDALVDATLANMCVGHSSFAELERADLLASVAVELGNRAGDHRALDRLAPTRVTLPGGRKLKVHYEPDRPPWVGSRLQDFFSMAEGPRILAGEVALVLHLRAPNRHDVAVTTDLAAFWREHYPSLAKQLGRRYPKHDWPDDPLTASPPKPGGGRRRRRRR